MAADSRSPRDGKHLEVLGYYNPLPGWVTLLPSFLSSRVPSISPLRLTDPFIYRLKDHFLLLLLACLLVTEYLMKDGSFFLAVVCREGWRQEDGPEIRPGEVSFTCLNLGLLKLLLDLVQNLTPISSVKHFRTKRGIGSRSI
jgi:hypothetical protein